MIFIQRCNDKSYSMHLLFKFRTFYLMDKNFRQVAAKCKRSEFDM